MPEPVPGPRTLYDKIWDNHVVHTQEDGTTILYIDRHIIHEVSTPQAFDGLNEAGRRVRRPESTLGTVDHNTPTANREKYTDDESFINDVEARHQVVLMEKNCQEHGVVYFSLADKRQGICHIVGPEQGFTLPGCTVVCGDSHTSTHGAFGAIAFGIGTTEVQHVLATQCSYQRHSKNMKIQIDGVLHPYVTSKDLILHVIGVIGTAGGTGHAIEYCGSTVEAMSMEARMSMCNMSIEAGARCGVVKPDQTTYAYIKGRPLAPKGQKWDEAVKFWDSLASDPNAKWDAEVFIKAEDIAPTITWGTSPQEVAPVTGMVPYPANAETEQRRKAMERMLEYMGLTAGTPIEEIKVDKVFIGSCTNSRIEDLRNAAAVANGRKVAAGVYAMVVPGSGNIKLQAEAEGLDRIFKAAGFDWREAGCSMCLAMNEDKLQPGERCASTSNRNFEGRQGTGGRTHLMSPAMAAAAAVSGHVTDVRELPAVPQGSALPKVEVGEAHPFAPLAHTFGEKVAEAVKAGKQVPAPLHKHEDVKGGIPKFGVDGVLTGIAAPMDKSNVDTDQVLPKEYLKKISKKGLAEGLFRPMRFDAMTGKEITDFVLNKDPWRKSQILVARYNFGCGSSREHAPWALQDFGFRAFIAESYGEIFYNNSTKNGLLPVVLTKDQVELCIQDAAAGKEITVDLPNQVVVLQSGEKFPFNVNPFIKHCLLEGLDDISLTFMHLKEIEAYEETRKQRYPWLDGNGYLQTDELGRIRVLHEGVADW
ncbi:hypothetical protein DACRYDRAFT_95366 [Dacryopinax primogenitus]|uniref:3-isopropylmalate dehydratase n=1 Tax=Dacryopinax primogenitus (strain DJM 731) TaxID=1858805 RepID=M5FU50_DACPD|nr:uncharacterized protein DACRYDRAFT_95366 [Dacryopinax primogenitus]EJU01211.1 hypothetical protein DACRYDRAFT_95366 [Dacryopinax primogenitus]